MFIKLYQDIMISAIIFLEKSSFKKIIELNSNDINSFTKIIQSYWTACKT